MSYRYDDHSETDQLHARQVGEAAPAQPQSQAFADAARTDAEIEQQVARVRWLMQREPVREGGN